MDLSAPSLPSPYPSSQAIRLSPSCPSSPQPCCPSCRSCECCPMLTSPPLPRLSSSSWPPSSGEVLPLAGVVQVPARCLEPATCHQAYPHRHLQVNLLPPSYPCTACRNASVCLAAPPIPDCCDLIHHLRPRRPPSRHLTCACPAARSRPCSSSSWRALHSSLCSQHSTWLNV